MAAPKTVVAGFDGSAQSRSAVWWAAYEASSRNAPLLIVHAFPVPLEELTRLRLPSEALEIGPLRSAAERLLDELAGECGSMLPRSRCTPRCAWAIPPPSWATPPRSRACSCSARPA
ncbi:universal stress protein [Saccharopolyspora spinosporotrichia]